MGLRGRDRTPADVLSQGRRGREGAGGGSQVAQSLGIPQSRATGSPFGPASVMVRTPQEFPPPGAVSFNLFGSATVTNAANSSPASLGFTLPPGSVGVVRGLTINANTLTAASDVRFWLLVNNSPPPGWNALTIFPRPAASVSVSWDSGQIVVPIPDNGNVQLQLGVGAGDAGSYLLGGSIFGWYYSKTVEEQYAGAIR